MVCDEVFFKNKGGMRKKVEESMEMAKDNVDVIITKINTMSSAHFILNGKKNLNDDNVREDCKGTLVTKYSEWKIKLLYENI